MDLKQWIFQRFIQRYYSLRWKLALLFGAPMLLLVILVAIDHYNRTQIALASQVEVTSIQLGEVILSGLHEAMLNNDHDMLQSVLMRMGQKGTITRVWVLDLAGVVKEASMPEEVGMRLKTGDLGCRECHRYSPSTRPRVHFLTRDENTLRVITPINNEVECQGCHPSELSHLGVLLVDTSLASTQNQILEGQQRNLVLTVLLILFGLLGTFEMVNVLVIRRVEVVQNALASFKKGDFSTRIRPNWRTTDELTYLAEDFNSMADAIARHQQEQTHIAQMRQQAILEERERIARELHDGVAQFLGFINTKVIASRLLLKKQQYETVDKHLEQMEQAVHDQSLDVRASIVGLKLDEFTSADLVGWLRKYIEKCGLFSDFAIQLSVDPDLEQIKLAPETELHLARIIQEAISNIRKHANAALVQVTLTREQDFMVLSVCDDGVGFNPWVWHADQHVRFGLQTMQERAEMIGGEFSIVSEPGKGTTVSVRLKLETNE